MKLLDYIRGLRKGKEAHRLEKESMQDPFLADAMDGYNQVEEITNNGSRNCGCRFLLIRQRKRTLMLSPGASLRV